VCFIFLGQFTGGKRGYNPATVAGLQRGTRLSDHHASATTMRSLGLWGIRSSSTAQNAAVAATGVAGITITTKWIF
tara:strand:+ start:538 stop:765 length:228 start_codon:yes stop_codon:yes gene_type:complete